jgi:hypothetical protein
VTPPDVESLRTGSSHNDRLAEILLREMREFRSEVGARLDRLVTQEAFQAEKERVNERMGDMREDLEAERRARERALGDEAKSRAEAVSAEAAARAADVKSMEEKRLIIEVEQEKARTRNRWFVGAALVPLMLWLMNYVLENIQQGGVTP